jgi:hypothetical protein
MRATKQLFGLVFLITMLINCNSEKGFTIKGHIEGIEDGTLITLFDLNQQFNLDSAFSKNGSFILKGLVEDPTTCWIKCKDEYAIIQVENTVSIPKNPTS